MMGALFCSNMTQRHRSVGARAGSSCSCISTSNCWEKRVSVFCNRKDRIFHLSVGEGFLQPFFWPYPYVRVDSLGLIYFLFNILSFIYGWVWRPHRPQNTHEVREQLGKNWFSLSAICSGDQTQVIRLGSKCLYLLSHHANQRPHLFFLSFFHGG